MKPFQKPMNMQEEEACLQAMWAGDISAKHILIERNLRLVAHVAKKYQSNDIEMEDMISVGTIGLIKAVETYHGDRGSRLATYAARCIENEILMYLRSRKKVLREVSIYEPIGTDREGNQIQLFDIMENQEPDIIEQLEQRDNIRKMYEVLPLVLTEKELEVIQRRYGLMGYKCWTQREVADYFRISRSYVSRIEKKALEKLRKEMYCKA